MKPSLMPDVYVYLNLHSNDQLPKELFEKQVLVMRQIDKYFVYFFRSVFTFKEKEGNTFVVPRPVVERLGYQVRIQMQDNF